jgi:hypothetical protein
MIGQEKAVRLLKALADKSRLQIVECIQGSISNPGKIARSLDRHRATVEKPSLRPAKSWNRRESSVAYKPRPFVN